MPINRMTTICRVGYLIFISCILLILSGWPSPDHVHSQTPVLTVGAVVSGSLGADDEQTWLFSPETDTTMTFFASRNFGDLDPMLTILDEAGTTLAENDDRQPGVILDAGVMLDVQADTTYTVIVRSFAGSGVYELVALPGFGQIWADETFTEDSSRWSSPYTRQEAERLILSNQQLAGRDVVAVPQGEQLLDDMAIHVTLGWNTQAATQAAGVGLRLQAGDALARDGYYFNVSPDGRWQVSKRVQSVTETLTSGQEDSLSGNTTIALTARANGSRLQLFAEEALLTEVTDDEFSAGQWGLHLLAAEAESSVAVERVLVTVPPTPLPVFPAELATWRSSQPADIAEELAAAGVIPEDGRRTYTVLETAFEVAPVTTITYPQVEPGVTFSNMLLNVDIQATNGVNIACGVSFHELGQQNLNMAYVDVDGGAGLLYVKDGVVQEHSYNLLEPPAEPLSGGRQRLTVIAYAEYVTLYVNGRWFVTQYSPGRPGTLGVALLNYATNSARCAFSNLWVWQ